MLKKAQCGWILYEEYCSFRAHLFVCDVVSPLHCVCKSLLVTACVFHHVVSPLHCVCKSLLVTACVFHHVVAVFVSPTLLLHEKY